MSRAEISEHRPMLIAHSSEDKIKVADTIYPDGMALVRVGPRRYRERLTGIELVGEFVAEWSQKIDWKLVFPRTGLELQLGYRIDGQRALYEFREAVKNVLARYLVTSRSPDGRIWQYIVDPNPLTRFGSHTRNKPGGKSSPTFLACL